MLENASYVNVSHQVALRRQMDIIANNIANLNTTAYRGERALFQEFLVPTSDNQEISFVQDIGLIRDLAEGEMVQTGNPLDVAINGRGFFVVETENGPRYTRNGNFTTNDIGQLVTNEGRLLLDEDNQPIQLDLADGELTIAGDGTITSEIGPIAKLQLVTFDNPQRLQKQGSTLYSTEDPPLPAENTRVVQGMLEKSNVQGVLEVTRMIHVMRSYQATQKMLDTGHELQRRAIDKLGRAASA